MFPRINTIDELIQHVGNKEEIRFKTEIADGEEFTIVCYMIADEDTFDSEWSRECRGVTFHKGRVVSRPFEKFFNYKENASVNEETLKNKVVLYSMDKLDGSMISFVNINNKFVPKTKKSFTSDVAIKAGKFLNNGYNEHVIRFLKYIESHNATAIFEYTAPSNRIVLEYKTEQLTLLAVRQNVTGEYLNMYDVANETFGIPVVGYTMYPSHKIAKIHEDTVHKTDIEGYVIQFEDGVKVKVKTQWYLDLHRVMTDLRERDIAMMIVEEKHDDIKSVIETNTDIINKINEIEHRIKTTYLEIIHGVDEITNGYSKDDIKAFATMYNKNKYFHLGVNKLRHGEYDIKDYFYRNHWKQDYTLDTLGSFQ